MDFDALRLYLGEPARKTKEEVANDAFRLRNPGAVELSKMVLEMRINKKTRRLFEGMAVGYSSTPRQWWVTLHMDVLWNFYRVSLIHGTFGCIAIFLYVTLSIMSIKQIIYIILQYLSELVLFIMELSGFCIPRTL